jgi:anti-sigma regulatory factor (Ser/Thr protein kinase)
VGGDWYDAFVLPNGAMAVAIGDVVGRGLGAASAMARLRNALRAYSLAYVAPADVLTQLDRLLLQLHPGEMATVLYGVIDPAQLAFRFACAAHVPPAIRDPDGSVRIVSVEPGPPLGAGVRGLFTEHAEQLSPGTTMVLCTDGLIERRGSSIDEGLRRLRDACAPQAMLDERCDQIVDRLVQGDGDDDIALLVVEVAPEPGDEWQTTIHADARQLVVLRTALRRWLTERGVAPGTAYDVLLACGEAAANAIEHAYGPSGGVILVGAKRAPDGIVVTVNDSGRWRSPHVAQKGRGILMMRQLADSVLISPSRHGTSVELHWSLGEAA